LCGERVGAQLGAMADMAHRGRGAHHNTSAVSQITAASAGPT
jgi:hypothetical protein